MTVGNTFPIITPPGQQAWWVIPEGFAGQLIGGFSTTGPMLHLYTVKQSNTPPPGEVAGPFTNQLQAQAAANKLNATGVATPGNVAGQLTGVNAIGDFFQRLTQTSTWIRVAEFVAGGLLIYMGGSAILRGTAAGNAAKGAASKGKKLAELIPK